LEEIEMSDKKKIEIFSAGCPVCEETVQRVQEAAGSLSEVSVLKMNDKKVAERTRKMGIRSVPALVIDGNLADCCSGRGPDEKVWKSVVMN